MRRARVSESTPLGRVAVSWRPTTFHVKRGSGFAGGPSPRASGACLVLLGHGTSSRVGAMALGSQRRLALGEPNSSSARAPIGTVRQRFDASSEGCAGAQPQTLHHEVAEPQGPRLNDEPHRHARSLRELTGGWASHGGSGRTACAVHRAPSAERRASSIVRRAPSAERPAPCTRAKHFAPHPAICRRVRPRRPLSDPPLHLLGHGPNAAVLVPTQSARLSPRHSPCW